MSLHLTRRPVLAVLAASCLPLPASLRSQGKPAMQSWKLATSVRTGIHDVAPAPDGGVWFSAQASGHLGWFEPATGRTELVPLSRGSSPHGVIQGPDKAAWLTDGGQNAIVRVSWPQRAITVFRLPADTGYANLNTLAFDGDGDVWFTGQGGYVGRVAVRTGQVSVKEAPRGRGPYGICATPSGDVWWCSLAGSFIAQIDRRTGDSRIVEPPTRGQGARRVWSDSRGRIWVSEWNSGQLSMHDPASKAWRAWRVPGNNPMIYAVYVDERDRPWVSDFGGNAVWSFDPGSEKFERHPLPRESGNVRQILGRKGEVWLPESGTEHITVIRT
ncbi:Vgb family protein [Ramlibacter alkalitolerans]|uniref:Virginiamycin B lyase n=1 Tax=Ramlibacter alkalitolerans TaxID=2039631 RepID=A0ABS1JV31_9BURK|nr:lyase [Ramlibacter alkalitolerans]MBL0428139.1 lyase [Ramlibacter alkalitolerans]